MGNTATRCFGWNRLSRMSCSVCANCSCHKLAGPACTQRACELACAEHACGNMPIRGFLWSAPRCSRVKALGVAVRHLFNMISQGCCLSVKHTHSAAEARSVPCCTSRSKTRFCLMLLIQIGGVIPCFYCKILPLLAGCVFCSMASGIQRNICLNGTSQMR